MHDSLRLKNLSRLSKSMRPVAEAIATGSLPAVRALLKTIPNMPVSQAILFLPALFVNVDSGRIPIARNLEATLSDSGSSFANTIHLALHSLNNITFLANNYLIPSDALPELWPHLWNWLDFLHTFWDALPMGANANQGMACYMHSSAIVSVSIHPDTAKIIRATPGVRRILARGWKTMVYDDFSLSGSMNAAIGILTILGNCFHEQNNYEEIVEAVGGTFRDLALTMVQHFVRSRSLSNLPDTSDFVISCFSFFPIGGDSIGYLKAALRSVGIIQTLVKTISALNNTAASEAIDLCLHFLVTLFKHPPGFPGLALAIEAGLLRVLVELGMSQLTAPGRKRTGLNMVSSQIKELLEVILPRATVHYAVVVQLKNTLPEAEELAIKLGFHKSKFSREWRTFADLAKTRIELLDTFERFSQQKACDYTECGKINNKRRLQCCSTCQRRNYCSKVCQSMDWRADHRNICQDLRLARLAEPQPPLSTRGKSFLRAVLTSDYVHQMLGILLRHAEYMHEHPGEPFFTAFIYSGPSGVAIDCRLGSKVADRDWAAQLPHEFARVARSGGRMEMHVMFIYEGEAIRRVFFPMRAPTSRLHDGVLRALELVPEGKQVKDVSPLVKASLKSMVEQLVRECLADEDSEVIFIH
ncbi:hypothetical protein B0H11DRAFT_2358234 [Mycena galericulata]|nr:hypothetical protein B0H11DRAFT_2358234 [Mycena galericulata]